MDYERASSEAELFRLPTADAVAVIGPMAQVAATVERHQTRADGTTRPVFVHDGTAGGVEPGAITFEVLDEVLNDFVTVEEDDIRAAFLDLIEVEHLLVEGSAAMAYAAARAHAQRAEGATAVILCGGNVGTEKLRKILD